MEVARSAGAEAHLIDDHTQGRGDWLAGERVIGVTSGASAPEGLVRSLVKSLCEPDVTEVQKLVAGEESVRLMLPRPVRARAPRAGTGAT